MTIWTPLTQLQRRTWLLANGEVATEPDLEESPSGRKVRVKGTTLSAYRKDMDDLLSRAVSELAEQRGTKLWMSLDRNWEKTDANNFDPRSFQTSELNILRNCEEDSVVWWRFKHPDLPIEATVFIRAEGVRRIYRDRNYPITVTTSVLYQHTGLDPMTPRMRFLWERQSGFLQSRNQLVGYDDQTRWDAFVRDNPPIWDNSEIGSFSNQNDRMVIKHMLTQVRKLDELTCIDIPDLRDPLAPGWLRLELFDSNLRVDFEQDCLDALDGASTVAEALTQYDEFRTTLSKVGMVLSDRGENDFIAALNGDKEPLTVRIAPVVGADGNTDVAHTVSLHLPTGTMYVHCDNVHTDHNEIAEKWEEAQLIASLSGKEDELLAYAREYVQRKQSSVMKDLVADRTIAD